jgi:type 1 glutamine amidotransferase
MRATILSGGVAHAFVDTSEAIASRLRALGVESSIMTDIEAGLLNQPQVDLLVFNVFRDEYFSARFPADVPDPTYTPSPPARQAVLDHLGRGGGLLALHGAVISFADWSDWRAILGAGWVPGTSGHPKRAAMEVVVLTDAHPIVAGVPSFTLSDDEPYGFLDIALDITPLATSTHGGVEHPMLWIREFGGGRVAYLAPAHGMDTHLTPTFQQLLDRTASWLMRDPTLEPRPVDANA